MSPKRPPGAVALRSSPRPGAGSAKAAARAATKIGAKTERARSSARWVARRRPQARSTSGRPQAARPTIIISGCAIEAPKRPSQFCVGASEARSQFGSSGE